MPDKDVVIEARERKYHGELWIDKDGYANFKWHIEGGDFTSAREVLVAFIACLQARLTDQSECPYYESASPVEASPIVKKAVEAIWRDLRDRQGFDFQIEDDVVEDILSDWSALIATHVKADTDCLRKYIADLEHDLNAAIQECNERHGD